MRFNFFKKIHKTSWLAALAILLVFCLSLVSLAAVNYDQTIAGLTLGGLKAGGIDENGLEQFLAGRIAEFNGQKISFAYEEKTWSFTPDDFGIEINANKTAATALAAGHGSFPTSMAEQIKTLFAGRNLPLDYSVNSPRLNRTLDILSSIETPAKNSSLKYDPQQNDFAVLPAQNGALIDRDKLIADILETFSRPAQNIQLSLKEKRPLITEAEINQVAEQAKQIINNAPYFLQSENATWRIDKAELTGWISAAASRDDPQKALLTLDNERISDFLIPLSASINREPTNAELSSANGELRFTVLSQNGRKLNIAGSVEKITAGILAGSPRFGEAGKKNIELAIDSIAPQISNQTTKELGILTLIGTGESNFSGSPTNRRINIKVGATKLNGFLIKPGEEFSFSQNIGEIDAQNGWVPELVIKNRQTIPEYGGGLCQVSTTLFRAAVNSGLKITDRHPHAYPVRYYDPPGFDATVYPPNPDLKFLNDTPGHIFLQSRIEGNKLFFEIYGTADGREVKIKGPFTTQKNPNGSLKATLTQEIWRDGQLERKQIFNSSYNSPALYPSAAATPVPSPSPSPAPSAPSPSPAASETPAPSPTVVN